MWRDICLKRISLAKIKFIIESKKVRCLSLSIKNKNLTETEE
jgi:hypothetical protein